MLFPPAVRHYYVPPREKAGAGAPKWSGALPSRHGAGTGEGETHQETPRPWKFDCSLGPDQTSDREPRPGCISKGSLPMPTLIVSMLINQQGRSRIIRLPLPQRCTPSAASVGGPLLLAIGGAGHRPSQAGVRGAHPHQTAKNPRYESGVAGVLLGQRRHELGAAATLA